MVDDQLEDWFCCPGPWFYLPFMTPRDRAFTRCSPEVFESAPHLMPSQLDSVAGELLKKQIETRPSQDTVMTLFFANRLW